MAGVVLVRSAGFYLAGFAAAAVLSFFLLGVERRGAGAPDEKLGENAATAAYVFAATSLPAAAGFAAVACLSRGWRSLRLAVASAIAAACGAFGYLAYLTGLGGAAGFFAIPAGLGAAGIVLRLVLPGAVLGVLAAGAARAMRPLSEKAA